MKAKLNNMQQAKDISMNRPDYSSYEQATWSEA